VHPQGNAIWGEAGSFHAQRCHLRGCASLNLGGRARQIITCYTLEKQRNVLRMFFRLRSKNVRSPLNKPRNRKSEFSDFVISTSWNHLDCFFQLFCLPVIPIECGNCRIHVHMWEVGRCHDVRHGRPLTIA